MKGTSENTPPVGPGDAPAATTGAPTSQAAHAGEPREAHGAHDEPEAAPSKRKRGKKDAERPVGPKRARKAFVPVPQGQQPAGAVRGTLEGSARAEDRRAPPVQAVPRPPGVLRPQPAASNQGAARVRPGRVYLPRPFLAEPLSLPPPAWARPPPPLPELPITREQLAEYAAHTGPLCPVPDCGAPAGRAHLETHVPLEMDMCGVCGLVCRSPSDAAMHIELVHGLAVFRFDISLAE